jgi:hypothetical protein
VFTVITLLIPLLGFWLSIALLLIDGFAMPLERMKAEHRAADCIVQVSLLKDQAIAQGSDQAKDCEKALDLTAALKLGKVLSGKNIESARAYSITSQTPTACALEFALCVQPENRAEPIALNDYRRIRYENHRCSLEAQRILMLSSQQISEPDSIAGSAGQDGVLSPQVGLAPLINCNQQGSIEIATGDWHCIESHNNSLRWWGLASQLSSPCLRSASQLSQGLEFASPSIGRMLKLRQTTSTSTPS